MKATLPLLLILVMGACDNLGLSREPNELSVQLEADGVNQVVLVTSTQWVFSADPACDQQQGCPDVLRVLGADTATVAVPFQRRFTFTDDYKYLVEAYPAGGVTAKVLMKIEIDGKEWFNEARDLTPTGKQGGQETLQFVYQWREPTIR